MSNQQMRFDNLERMLSLAQHGDIMTAAQRRDCMRQVFEQQQIEAAHPNPHQQAQPERQQARRP